MSVLSIEVDNVEVALLRERNAGLQILCGPVTEPRCVRQFFVNDPFGKLFNIPAYAGRPPAPD